MNLRKQSILILFLLLVSCTGQASGPIQIPMVWGPGVAITRTPFQALSPTPRPTIVPSPTPLPSPTDIPCLDMPGRVERQEIPSSASATPIIFRIYLPACLDQGLPARYPVLYILHGQTFADDQWDRLGIDEAADALIAARKSPPFLIVMPLERDTFADIFTSPFSGDLVGNLVPWVDVNYPTCAERACRAIGGLSRGGAWSFRLGFMHWELFGAIGMHSTPPFIGDPNRLSTWLQSIPPGELPRIYMDTGQNDYFINLTRQLEELLVQYNVPHEWYLFKGTHDEAYWSGHVTDYLEWYTRPWVEPAE